MIIGSEAVEIGLHLPDGFEVSRGGGGVVHVPDEVHQCLEEVGTKKRRGRRCHEKRALPSAFTWLAGGSLTPSGGRSNLDSKMGGLVPRLKDGGGGLVPRL